ncbi:FUSC family protein [Enterococcus diestrammenae]|uniref:FUSC family protein n=1 Tax=Enterococcus diestrammenae TaxID=1155073 RepID=UPI0019569718|nr:aromatic acid exporter family protein [Enterococcus diestrammenae]HIX69450.1 FUSC family protein [Candidatus Enterococcus stercoravium]
MHIGRFRIGMRTMKTALAVMICILLFKITDRREPLIAALAAVFSLRQDLTTTVSFGRSRVLGNSMGGLFAIFYFFIKQYVHQDFLLELFLLPLLVALIIILSDGINNNAGIVSAIATMLLITLSVTRSESIYFALQRVIDTFIGTFVAIAINFLIRPPEKEKESEIKEDLVVLKQKEAKLQEMLKEVQTQIKAQQDSSKDEPPT